MVVAAAAFLPVGQYGAGLRAHCNAGSHAAIRTAIQVPPAPLPHPSLMGGYPPSTHPSTLPRPHAHRLEELNLANNNLATLPPQLGLLAPVLRSLGLEGNPLRSIRRPILERGTPAVLAYLKDRIPA